MPQVNLGDGSGKAVVQGTVNYMSAGGDIGALLSAGLLGFLLAPFMAGISIIHALGHFVTFIVDRAGTGIGNLVFEIFDAPAMLLGAGAQTSAQALHDWRIWAFWIAMALVLGGLMMVAKYREFDFTGNLIPGLPFDVPFIGSAEKPEEDIIK